MRFMIIDTCEIIMIITRVRSILLVAEISIKHYFIQYNNKVYSFHSFSRHRTIPWIIIHAIMDGNKETKIKSVPRFRTLLKRSM